MENIIAFSPDERAVLLKSIAELYHAAQTLHFYIKDNSLPEDMKAIMPSLIEGHFRDIAKKLDYESALAKEREERFAEIRKANQTIKELKDQLGSQKPIDGLNEQLRLLNEKVENWWNEYGFNHISSPSFTAYGRYHGTFSFMLSSRESRYSETPESDKAENEKFIQSLRDKGFEFATGMGNDYELSLIDNDNNKKLLIEMLKERFPSIEVHSFKSRRIFKSNTHIIQEAEFSIYKLQDI